MLFINAKIGVGEYSIYVAHCGDTVLSKMLTVNEFLYRCRDRFGKGCRIFDLPTKLLSEFCKLNVSADVTFFVAGYFDVGIGCCVYKIKTMNKTIEMPWSDGRYGASFGGMTDIVYAMMKDADYDNMSLSGCENLIKTAVDSSILSFSYQNPQSIGGHCDMYIISADGLRVGQVVDNGLYLDKAAPIDAYETLMAAKVEKLVAQQSKMSRK